MKTINVEIQIIRNKDNRLVYAAAIDDFSLADNYVTILEIDGNRRQYNLSKHYSIGRLSATRQYP